MELNLKTELKVIEATRLVLDGRLKGGSKIVPAGFKVVIAVAGAFGPEHPGHIMLSGPHPTREAADTAMANIAASRFIGAIAATDGAAA